MLIAAQGLLIRRTARLTIPVPDLCLADGERLALIGPTGSGKSTLLHALLGFVPLTAGTIRLLGRDCRDERDFAVMRGPLGLVFQDPVDQLFGPTVREDVAFGPLNQGLDRDGAWALAGRTLDRLDIGELADRPVHHLSGGEQRLVCLAGVLAMDPQVLLLDEPTVGLDDASRDRLLDVLLATGLPMLVATHDTRCLQMLATRALRLPVPPRR